LLRYRELVLALVGLPWRTVEWVMMMEDMEGTVKRSLARTNPDTLIALIPSLTMVLKKKKEMMMTRAH
jgi:hypothetical protein